MKNKKIFRFMAIVVFLSLCLVFFTSCKGQNYKEKSNITYEFQEGFHSILVCNQSSFKSETIMVELTFIPENSEIYKEKQLKKYISLEPNEKKTISLDEVYQDGFYEIKEVNVKIDKLLDQEEIEIEHDKSFTKTFVICGLMIGGTLTLVNIILEKRKKNK